jgi:septal ring factor EnvC (AmiA/AmiB activator)
VQNHDHIPPQYRRELARLNELECEISQRRQQLHRRIDDLHASVPLDAGRQAVLDDLEREEREISDGRSKLHDEVDALRVSIGLPASRRGNARHHAA